MAKRATDAGEIVKATLKKFPETDKKTIARKLQKENPLLFPDIESARSMIRYYTGQLGIKNRKTLAIHDSQENFFIPEPDIIDFEPYVLPKTCKSIGIMGDIHVPYHDKEPIETAVEWMLNHEIDTLILNGDVIDNYQWSDFVRDINKRDAKGEFEMLVKMLQYLESKFPKCKRIWKEGNHEERLERYLKTRAPILWNLAEVSIPDVLSQYYGYDLQLHGWDYVKDKKIIKAGELAIIHGHEIQGGGTVNLARNLFLRTYSNVLKAHSHKKNDDIVRSINEKFYGTWAIGCLCQLHPDYNPINQWTQGFAHVKQYDDGTFAVANRQIINGRVV